MTKSIKSMWTHNDKKTYDSHSFIIGMTHIKKSRTQDKQECVVCGPNQNPNTWLGQKTFRKAYRYEWDSLSSFAKFMIFCHPCAVLDGKWSNQDISEPLRYYYWSSPWWDNLMIGISILQVCDQTLFNHMALSHMPLYRNKKFLTFSVIVGIDTCVMRLVKSTSIDMGWYPSYPAGNKWHQLEECTTKTFSRVRENRWGSQWYVQYHTL